MKIAVTGATGFIGSHLVRHLSRAGHQVLAVGRVPTAPPALEHYAEYLAWDITRPTAARGDIDAVVHAAAVAGFAADPKIMRRVNVDGTRNVLAWARSAQRRILISSSSVYPTTTDGQPKIETSAGARPPGTVYGQTKLAAERLWLAAPRPGSTVVLRPHAVYGPGDRTLLPSLVRRIRRNRFYLVGNGENQFTLTHVGNLCQAVTRSLATTGPMAEAYNIADADSASLQDALARVFRALGLEPTFKHVPIGLGTVAGWGVDVFASLGLARSPDRLSRDFARRFSHPWVVPITKAEAELKYHPQFTLADGLRDIAEWVTSIGGVQNLQARVDSWVGRHYIY